MNIQSLLNIPLTVRYEREAHEIREMINKYEVNLDSIIDLDTCELYQVLLKFGYSLLEMFSTNR